MSNISTLVSTLDQKRQELARIEIELKQVQQQRLGLLAEEMGFASTDDLVHELAAFVSPDLAAAIKGEKGAFRHKVKHPLGIHGRPRKRRASVSGELREKIASELRAGTRTAIDIARSFDVSTSLVNQLKKKLGLTAKRRA